LRLGTVDNPFTCDIGAFVTIQDAIMKRRTIGLIGTLTLGLLAAPLPAEAGARAEGHGGYGNGVLDS